MTIYSAVSGRNSVAAPELADKPGESIDFHGICPDRNASQKGMFETSDGTPKRLLSVWKSQENCRMMLKLRTC
jgi:hypothetical protein